MRPTRIILIRHGQTIWNLKKKYCGFTDVALNQNGIKQARKLSRRLIKEEIHNAYSSNMKRTCQFAHIALKNYPIRKLPELREINFGIFEGMTYKQIVDKYLDIYTKWLSDPLNFIIPEGESLGILAKRVRKIFKKILSENSCKTVVVFSHAGPIRIILCDILKLSLKEFWQLNPGSASMSILEFNRRIGKIKLLNDTSYLTEK